MKPASCLPLALLLTAFLSSSIPAAEVSDTPPSASIERRAAHLARTDSGQLQSLHAAGITIDSVTPGGIRVWVTDKEFEWARSRGWDIRPIPPSPDDYWPDVERRVAKGLTYPLSAYPTYAEITAAMEGFVSTYPELCRLVSIGKSVENRDLWFLKITDNPAQEEDEPEFKYISTMHGNETLGVVLCLNLIHDLLAGHGTDPRLTSLVDETEIWILPLMNPDGYSHSPRSRFNAQGIDLNRNFPDRVEGDENDPTGRAPEVRAVMNFSAVHSFVLSANFHTGALVVNYPYDNSEYAHIQDHPDWYTPDNDVFVDASLAYSSNNPPMYASPYFTNGITNGIAWYTLTGGMQDWNYVWMGCNEVTIEVSDLFSPSTSALGTLWNQNRESMLSYLEKVHTGIRGVVTDSAKGEPLAAEVRVVGRDHPVFTDPDVGDFHRLLRPGTYDLTFTAPGFYPRTVEDVSVIGETATRLDVTLDPIVSGIRVW